MRASTRLIPTLICVIVFLTIRAAAAGPASTPAPGAVDFRDEKGNVLIGADRIASYNWFTHTITLTPGSRPGLPEALGGNARLVSGIPFAICVGGKAIFSGVFTTSMSSKNFSQPVIVVDPVAYNTAMLHDDFRIQLGYPTRQFFRGDDPRGDQRLRAALRAAGKLAKAPPEYSQWIADSLREIQTLGPGTTRADLLKIFQEEGGLSTRTERRFAYRDCPYIKVDLKFEPADTVSNKNANCAEDKIRSMSQPFLEWSIGD